MRIALRPRRPWEAMDLGLTMVQRWWKVSYATWFMVSLPVFIVANLALGASAWAMLVIWWLKPAFERPLLYIYSHAVFGARPGLRQTLHALPGLLLRSGLGWHLTLGRIFDPARSYRLPVWQLEGLRGKPRRERLRVLGARDTSFAVGMLLVYLHLEMLITVGLLALGYLMLPAGVEANPLALFESDDTAVKLMWNTLTYLGYSVIAPPFVASGFALYLNRRTVLEAWDIELNLRRMARRLDALRGVAAATLLVAVLAGLPASPPARAATDGQPQQVIAEVLSDPDFGSDETVRRWRYRVEPEPDDGERWNIPALHGLGNFLATAVEAVFWVAVTAAGIWAVIHLLRNAGPLRNLLPRRRISRAAMPDSIGAIELDAENLPRDVLAAALAAWQAGEARQALGLLYRGAIVAMLERGIRLPDSATEGDVLERSRTVLTDSGHGALTELVHSWQAMAYAHRGPDQARFEQLCAGFREHLRGPSP